MAYYAALVSLVQLLEDITHHHPYPYFLLDKHQLHFSVYEKFKLLLEMLDGYSPKDHEEKANGILESRIRDAAYRAQDMIESRISATLVTRIHLEERSGRVDRLGRPWSSISRYVPDDIGENKYDQDLEKVKTEVDSVLEDLIRMKEESNTVHENLQPKSHISVEASRVQAPSGKNAVFVFDEDLRRAIKAQLCGESSKLEVISITGMGGLGKTTLARNIFYDKLIHDRFDCRAWVTVSQDYHLKTILLAIVKSLGINEREPDVVGLGEDVLRLQIYKYLFGRRYLIVMDDVWEAKLWDDIRRIFPDNLDGSRIMITTRLSDVADYASNSKFLHQMPFLDEDQSWTILREKVFAAQEHCPKELEVIGKLIAKNCGGLPLAIVVIAGVLSNVKRAQYDWEDIARKVSSTAIDQNNKHLSRILSFSYNHLPHHLKPCFLYFGGYPEDHEIRISKLIRLWVAEGFLKPVESKSLEEAGEEYLTDLVNRNLVLITKKKSDGKFKFCIIHDLLRELCSQRARDENFLLRVQRKEDLQEVPIENICRVYMQTLGGSSEILKYIKKHSSHVRSLICCSPASFNRDDLLPAASDCKLLRILDTRVRFWNVYYHKITKLLHSRYVKIYEVGGPVPSRIFLLQNLQTVIFDSTASLTSEFWKMPQLRHVISTGFTLPPIPYDEVRITNGVPLLGGLQTLSEVEVLYGLTLTRDTIEMIRNLRKFGVRCKCKSDQIWEELGLSNLVHFHQLETLRISFDIATEGATLPKKFALPSTLIKLTLFNCKLPWKDMSVVGSLPNLQVLKLREAAFVGEEWEPTEGEFQKLKYLEMNRLHRLKYWRAENTHFPRLEHLHIEECSRLEEIPSEIGDILTLKLIKLNVWYKSNPTLESSALEIEQQQRDLGNDDLQVHVSYSWSEVAELITEI